VPTRATQAGGHRLWRALAFALAGLVLLGGFTPAQDDSPDTRDTDTEARGDTAPLQLSDDDRAWLRTHSVIRVGAEVNYAPYEFRDARGRFTGVVADYLELIRRRLGNETNVRFEVVQLPEFSAVEERLQRREVDIVLALMPSRERTDYLTFTRPYLEYVNVVVTRDDHEFVTGMADFAGRKIAVVQGHSAQQLVARAFPAQAVTPYADILDALMAVSTGRVDALVDDIFPVVHNIRQRQIGNLKLATPVEKSLQASGFSIAVRSDWPELVGILDDLLDTVTPQEQRAISQKWLAVRVDSKLDTRTIWMAAAVFTTLLTVAVVWIRQLRRQRSALEAARAQAEAANRAKDSFLAGMSHELRTPLHAILGYAELLRDDRLRGQAHTDALATIASSGRHLLALINDLLDLSRIRSGHMELQPTRVRLRNLIDEVTGMIRIEARLKGLDFVVQTGDELPAEVDVDAKRLRQVLLNLLGNAIKFTDRGSVTLTVRCEAATDALASLTIAVDDTGLGIDPADRERIFAPFEQGAEGRRRESGVGLGLAISREIVQRMQGDIRVSARPEGGSRFTVSLAVRVLSAAMQSPLEQSSIESGGSAHRSPTMDELSDSASVVARMRTPLVTEVEATEPPAYTDVSASELPSVECLCEIKSHARLGRWVQIDRIARDLTRQGGGYAAFLQEIQAFVRDFDEHGLELYLEQSLNATLRGGRQVW